MPVGFFKRALFFVSLVLAAAAGFFAVGKMLEVGPKAQLLSRGKPASQSSTYSGAYAAENGVDGVRTTFFHTVNEDKPWWQVDLGSVHKITQVTLFNRTDAQARAYNCVILTSEDGKSWTRAYDNAGQAFGDGINAGNPLQAKVSASARYVRVQLKDKEFLHLSEVEVFGY